MRVQLLRRLISTSRAFVFLGILLVGCGPSAIPEPSTAHVAAAQQGYPGTTQTDLEEGRRLLISHCSGCHSTPSPSALRSDQWPAEVASMAPRARIDDTARQKIEAYLVGVSSVH